MVLPSDLKAKIEDAVNAGQYLEVKKLIEGVKQSEVRDSETAAELLEVLRPCIENKCCALDGGVQTAIVNKIRDPIMIRADEKTYFDAVILNNRILLIQNIIPHTQVRDNKKMSLEQFKTFACQYG